LRVVTALSRALVGLGDQDKVGAWNKQDSRNKHTLLLTFLGPGCPPPFRAFVLNTTAEVVFRAGGHVRLFKASLHYVLLISRPQARKYSAPHRVPPSFLLRTR